MLSYTVTELNQYVKVLLEKDLYLSRIWVKGEVSNLKVAMSGHLYFTLKDQESSISTVIFKGRGASIKGELKNGQEILVKGRVSLYPVTGQYQFYGEEVIFSGLGNLHLEIEALKKELQGKGFFDEVNKQGLPLDIRTIGVVTSEQGAVIHDIKKVVAMRNPFVEIVLYPAVVQGDGAARSLVAGLEAFNRYADVDVIIIGRGGGSLEDLMAFNSREVVEAIFNSKIPVISAVGHETDVTLCDFVSDVRGATPSQGAELVTKDIRQRMLSLEKNLGYAFKKIKRAINETYYKLDQQNKVLVQMALRVQKIKERLDQQGIDLVKVQQNILERKRERLDFQREKLDILSPLSILKKGYSITYTENKKLIKNVKEVHNNDIIKVVLSKGTLTCMVQGKEGQDGD